MPFDAYQHLSDDDARAVVAYLRTVPAYRQAKPRPDNKLGFMPKLLFRVIGVQMHKPVAGVTAPDRAEQARIRPLPRARRRLRRLPLADGEGAAARDRSAGVRGQRRAVRGSRRSARSTRATSAAIPRPASAATTRRPIKQALRNGHAPRRQEAGVADVDPDSAHLGDERRGSRRARSRTSRRCRRRSTSRRTASWSKRCARSSAADEGARHDMSETVDQPPPPPIRGGLARAHRAAADGGRGRAVDRRASGPCCAGWPRSTSAGWATRTARWSRCRRRWSRIPTSGRVVQEMERVARSSGCWKELVAVTAEVAAGLDDPQAVGGSVGADRVLGRERPGLPRRGGQRGARRARTSRPATAARSRCSRISTSGSAAGTVTSRSWRTSGTSSRPRIPTSCWRRIARCCATSRSTRARSTAWRGIAEETGGLGDGGRRVPEADRRAAAGRRPLLRRAIASARSSRTGWATCAAPRSSWSRRWPRPAARATSRAC